jgi:ATP-dependent DNA ligase
MDANRSDLERFERSGLYIAERKKDGIWGQLGVEELQRSRNSLQSRMGQFIDVPGLERLDLRNIGRGTQLIGEPEIRTQAAKKRNAEVGFVRMWLHDIIMCRGMDLRNQPLEVRQHLLRDQVWPMLSDQAKLRLPLVEQTTTGFLEFYDQALRDGDEGVVIKKLGKMYKSGRSDGKTDDWVRIKPWREVDYVVMHAAETASGDLTVQLGLWRNGKIVPILKYQLRNVRLIDGQLVRWDARHKVATPCEGMVVTMRGREIMESGALRHAQFKCWREDKSADMCNGYVQYVEM